MINEFEYKGIWWLPDKTREKILGTLKVTPTTGATLDLIGSFKNITGMNNFLNPEIILGISSDGKNISLHERLETTSNLSSYDFLTSSYYVNKVFVGAHFQRTEDIRFKSLSVHYLYLDEWSNMSGFDREICLMR